MFESVQTVNNNTLDRGVEFVVVHDNNHLPKGIPPPGNFHQLSPLLKHVLSCSVDLILSQLCSLTV